MAGTPIDLSAYKPTAGNALAAAPISNMMTAIESYTTNAIDPASLKQNAATIGQVMQWNGTLWAPGGPLIAPTMIGPTAWPTTATALVANTAYLLPIPNVCVTTTVSKIGFYISAGGSNGNTDVGIYYSDDEATFTRLVAKGSTATPASGGSVFTIASTAITPVTGRRWYFAIGCSSVTPTFATNAASVLATGSYQKVTSFPLPASLTGMSANGVNLFLYGMI